MHLIMRMPRVRWQHLPHALFALSAPSSLPLYSCCMLPPQRAYRDVARAPAYRSILSRGQNAARRAVSRRLLCCVTSASNRPPACCSFAMRVPLLTAMPIYLPVPQPSLLPFIACLWRMMVTISYDMHAVTRLTRRHRARKRVIAAPRS